MNENSGAAISQASSVNSIEGRVGWRSPSNIALVKYWGKRPNQIPENPSISLTLSKSYTETFCNYKLKQTGSDNIDIRFYFEGKENEAFGTKIRKWLDSLKGQMPWLTRYVFHFESTNSFPHSAGIASSASAMSAISLCLCDIQNHISGSQSQDMDMQKASELARLGSGSACRSVYPHAAIWGKMEGSVDEFAKPMSEFIDPIFHSFRDTILIVDKSPKSVSSTLGHGLMKDNVFAAPRYQQARNNMKTILEAMKSGDLEHTGQIIEQEAMTLHAMMMLSDFMLLKPGSLSIIEAIRNVRKEKGWPVYFTIDAGPNIHLLYPEYVASEVNTFIESDLKKYCQDGHIIYDQVGTGPIKLTKA